MTQELEPRSRHGAIFDVVSIALFLASWWVLFGALVTAAGPFRTGLCLLLLVVPALLVVELAAGLFHWFADTFFDPDTPWIGPAVIKSFRDHHAAPGDMAERSAAEVSGQNCFACLPILALAGTLDLAAAPAQWLVALLLLSTLGVALTNLFHQWAHAERVPRWVGALQRRGWILSPAHHARHHCGAHDRVYCVTTGWLNPLLDHVGFFRALERVVERLAPRARRELANNTRAH